MQSPLARLRMPSPTACWSCVSNPLTEDIRFVLTPINLPTAAASWDQLEGAGQPVWIVIPLLRVKISERGGESIRTGRNFRWSGKFFKLEWPTCFVKPQKSSCWQCLAGWHIHCSLENWEDCMVSTRGNRDQKISFYFIFIVDHFSI